MKEWIWFIIEMSVFITTGFILGWVVNDLYEDNKTLSSIEGLYLSEIKTHQEVLEVASSYDEYGDWVCVNVNGMTFKRGLEVCKHEMGHEIFAEYCEDNWEECEKLTNG